MANYEDVVLGGFTEFRMVKTRSVAQYIIEGPLEELEKNLRVLGVPSPGREVWVAIAVLREKPTGPVTIQPDRPASLPKPDPQGRRCKQAVTVCGQPEFQKWLLSTGRFLPVGFQLPEDGDLDGIVKDVICNYCGVMSRRELDQQETAGRRWDEIFGGWMDYRTRGPGPQSEEDYYNE